MIYVINNKPKCRLYEDDYETHISDFISNKRRLIKNNRMINYYSQFE